MEKTAKVLAAGAGHLYGTSLPVGGTNTHAVISAHTGYDRLMFDRLSLGQGHVGDRFTIEVLGHTLAYRVTDIRVIDPDDFSVFGIEAGKDEVSLLTCTPYGVNTRRLVVTGERVDIPDPAPAPDDVPLARPGGWLLAAVGVAMALTAAMVLAAVPAGMAAAAAPAYVSAALSKVADGTGHGTPNQMFVNAANGFEVGDNAPDDGVVSSGDLVLYRLDLGFTAASARTVRVRWDLADAPYLEGGTEFCYSGAQVTASVRDDGSCVFTMPAGVAESVSRQIVLRGRDTGARVVDGQRARLWVERVSRARNGSWVADGENQMRPADPVTVVSAPAADLVVRDYEPKGAERRSSWSGEGADASATGYVDLDVVPLAYPGWSSHGASTGGKWQASVNVGAFPEGTSWLLVAGSGEDSSSWPLTVTDGMLRLPRISGDARLEWTLPASVLTDDWERDATRTFDIQVIPDEDAFAADDAHLLNLGTGGEPGRAQGRDVDSRNDDYGSLTGYPYPNNDWSRASVRGLRVILHDTDAVRLETDAQSVDVSFVVRIAKSVGNDDASGDHRVNDWMTMRWTRNDDASMTGCSPNGVWVTSPRDPYTALGLSVVATSPQGGNARGGGHAHGYADLHADAFGA